MKSIIVPVNFSLCSANAAHYAANLALETGTELHLLHVIQIPLPSVEMVMNEYLYTQMAEAAEAGLKGLLNDIRKHTADKIRVQTHVETGEVAGKVNELFSTVNADLVEMGVTRPTMEKFLTGSVVGAILHLRHPLLVVPEHTPYEPFRRFVLACDENDINRGIPNSLPLLCELRDHYHATVDVITVNTSMIMSDEARCIPAEGCDSLGTLHPLHHYVRQHNVEEGLEEYLHGDPGELAVVFPKRHSLLEFHMSHSGRVAKHASTPVLNLPE